MGEGGRSLASSASLKTMPIPHMSARTMSVTPVKAMPKPTIDLRSSSVSKGAWVEGFERFGSAMAERLLERGFAVRQERTRLELAGEEEEPQPTQRERRRYVERMNVGVLGKRGRHEPVQVEPAHDEHHAR